MAQLHNITEHALDCRAVYIRSLYIHTLYMHRVEPLNYGDMYILLGQNKVSCLVRCPDFRVIMDTNRVFGRAKCVLFIKVSLFQGVLMNLFNRIYKINIQAQGELCVPALWRTGEHTTHTQGKSLTLLGWNSNCV